ncbi:hypothetical protein WJX72_010948 [[Myrmecia] bisecta]|uniref:Pseudouridine synthase RsuA/RluA-like domain-containing protein n=1 Tax=[Myrmecia] bisecta TaxID=41462 RepID=A0AAW1Q4U9_9CHLO
MQALAKHLPKCCPDQLPHQLADLEAMEASCVESLLSEARTREAALQRRCLEVKYLGVDEEGQQVKLEAPEVAQVVGLPISRVKRIIQAGKKGIQLPPDHQPIEVVYEDEHVLAVNKPPGLVTTPIHRYIGGSLVNRIIAYLGAEPYPVHRLDMFTSGVVIIGKTSAAAASLHKQFRNKTVQKTYLAIALGAVAADTFSVDAPIDKHNKDEMARKVGPHGKPALTHFQLLSRSSGPVDVASVAQLAPYVAPGLVVEDAASLVRCSPQSGRTHQIRLHLAHAGHPIVGDDYYGISGPWIPRQALHAAMLEVKHPGTGQPLVLKAPVPDDFRQACAELKLRKGCLRAPTYSPLRPCALPQTHTAKVDCFLQGPRRAAMAPVTAQEPATDRTSMQSDRSAASNVTNGHPAHLWSVNSGPWAPPPPGPWTQPHPGYYPAPYGFNPYAQGFVPAYAPFPQYVPPPPGAAEMQALHSGQYAPMKSMDEPASPTASMRSDHSNVSAYDSYFYRPAIPVRSHRISIALDEDDGLTTKELRAALDAAARGEGGGYRPRKSIHSHRLSIAERPRESFDSIAHSSYQALGQNRPRPSVEYFATTAEEDEEEQNAVEAPKKQPRVAPLALHKIEERGSQDSHAPSSPVTKQDTEAASAGTAMNRLGSVAQDSARSLSGENDRPYERAVETIHEKIPKKVVEEYTVPAKSQPVSVKPKSSSSKAAPQKSGFGCFSCFSPSVTA